jgi:hypothetical protein
LRNANSYGPAIPAQTPILVGSSSRSQSAGPEAAFEFEIRVKLTPTEARLLRCLPIVGECVRQWRVPVGTGDWRPHPTAPGVEIQFGAA